MPAAPANCTGTAAFLLADEQFPDTSPVAGNGYRPQAARSCGSTGACFLVMDFPWGNVAGGSFVAHPAVNVALPDVTSSAGTLSVLQQQAATIQNQIDSSGNTLDNGPILGAYRETPGRPDVVGDMVARLDLHYSAIHAAIRGAVGQASAAYTAGTTIVLSAAPKMPPSMTLPAGGGGNLFVQDATTACAIGPTTTLAAWNGGTRTLTLSAPVNAAAPCPGIASGDLISITDSQNPHSELAFAPNSSSAAVFFIGEGLRTTGTAGINSACGPDPGWGNFLLCGGLQVGAGGAGTIGQINIYGDTATSGDGPFLGFYGAGNVNSLQLGSESVVVGSGTSSDGAIWSGQHLKLWGGGRTQTPADLQIGTDGGVTAGNATDEGAGTIDAIKIYAGGAQLLPVLAATSGSIGGSAVGAGACTSGTVAVAGSTTGMAVAATPATYPGDGFGWRGYVSAAGTVTLKLCNETAGSLTPAASAYNVRVLQ